MEIEEYTDKQLLRYGLELLGYSVERQRRVCRATNLHRFKSQYGSIPKVYNAMWVDLQTTEIEEARIDLSTDSLDMYLMAIYLLRKYPTEDDLEPLFDICAKTGRKWSWYFVRKFAALKDKKITWPEEWDPDHPDFEGTPIFLISVDGVHCRIHEPKHPTLSKNPAYYSHKFNEAGYTYELAVALWESRLVWIRGPFKASVHDVKIFKRKGLRNKLPPGKRGFADNGYRGVRGQLSTPNRMDPEELRHVKGRGRARQETFNDRIKTFKCLRDTFRHSRRKHKAFFTAVCVICQYQMENGSPLFEI